MLCASSFADAGNVGAGLKLFLIGKKKMPLLDVSAHVGSSWEINFQAVAAVHQSSGPLEVCKDVKTVQFALAGQGKGF